MDMKKRIMIAVAILLVDSIFFFLPLTAVFLAYIIIFNPPWFRDFFNRLNGL